MCYCWDVIYYLSADVYARDEGPGLLGAKFPSASTHVPPFLFCCPRLQSQYTSCWDSWPPTQSSLPLCPFSPQLEGIFSSFWKDPHSSQTYPTQLSLVIFPQTFSLCPEASPFPLRWGVWKARSESNFISEVPLPGQWWGCGVNIPVRKKW